MVRVSRLAVTPFLGAGSRPAVTLSSALFAVGSRGPRLLGHSWFGRVGSLPAVSVGPVWGYLGALSSSPAWCPPPAVCASPPMPTHSSSLVFLPSLAGLPGLGGSAHLTGCSRLAVALGPAAGPG